MHWIMRLGLQSLARTSISLFALYSRSCLTMSGALDLFWPRWLRKVVFQPDIKDRVRVEQLLRGAIGSDWKTAVERKKGLYPPDFHNLLTEIRTDEEHEWTR